MKVAADWAKNPKQVLDHPDWYCYGVVEDGGCYFVYLQWLKAPSTDENGIQLKGPDGRPLTEPKEYIEEAIGYAGFDNTVADFQDLRYIEDQIYHAKIQKFFMDKILWREVIENKKRIMENNREQEG